MTTVNGSDSGAGGQMSRGPSTEEPVLEVASLSVHFGGVAALSDVALTVPHHAFMAIVGANGAGKSTLLNAVSGLVRSDKGSVVRLSGTSISGRRAHQRVKVGIGRSFQDPAMLEEETVLENLLAGAHTSLRSGPLAQVLLPWRSRRDESEATTRARRILDLLDIRRYEDVATGSVAYGVQKLVDIGRAMMTEPKVLLLDEPTSGLVARERESLIEALLRLKAGRSTAVLFVEHHFDVVDAVADFVTTLDAGTVTDVEDRQLTNVEAPRAGGASHE